MMMRRLLQGLIAITVLTLSVSSYGRSAPTPKTVKVAELLSCGSLERDKCPPMDSARANKDATLAGRAIAWLKDNKSVRGVSVNKLARVVGELGSSSDCALLVTAATSRSDLESRVDLLMAGARLLCTAVAEPLIAILKGDVKEGDKPEQRNQVLAAGGLGIVGSKTAAPALIIALSSEWPRLQAAAAQALGMVGGESAIAPLMRIAGKGDVYAPTRTQALIALARLKAVDALPLATALVNAAAQKIGRAALAVIAASPVHWTVPVIAHGLRTPGLRAAAARAAIANPHKDLAPIALDAELADGLTPEEREGVLAAIGVLRPAGSANKLMARIEKADRRELIALMKTLPMLGDRTIVPKLVRYLPHAEPEVAKFVVYALENVTGKRLGLDVPGWYRYAGLDQDGVPSTDRTTPSPR